MDHHANKHKLNNT